MYYSAFEELGKDSHQVGKEVGRLGSNEGCLSAALQGKAGAGRRQLRVEKGNWGKGACFYLNFRFIIVPVGPSPLSQD